MIHIGPAGWKYKDWEGVVYPEPPPRGFDPLGYTAEYFTTAEINSSYYGPRLGCCRWGCAVCPVPRHSVKAAGESAIQRLRFMLDVF
jgi:hypothetical protein